MAKIVFEDVTKTFPTKDKKSKEQFTALDGIDLEIEAGSSWWSWAPAAAASPPSWTCSAG